MDILNQSREETQKKAENILLRNQTNNKVTHENFKKRDYEERKYILDLMKVLGYFEYINSPEYFTKIMKVIFGVNKIVNEYKRPINNEYAQRTL